MSAARERSAWLYQWSRLHDDSERLFRDWIHPNRLEDLRGLSVLDAGCGGGEHLRLVARHAHEVVGVDLECASLAAERCRDLPNVTTDEADVVRMDLGRRFDVVYSVGVLHHTEDPRAAFLNLARHVEPGGRLIVWVYSREGNLLNRVVLEPLKRRVLHRWPRGALLALAHLATLLLYVPVHTIYRLPLRFLPYHAYFANFRRLSYRRNLLNVFDKLNAPRTAFIRRDEVEEWFSHGFRDVHVSSYVGVSWRASGTRADSV